MLLDERINATCNGIGIPTPRCPDQPRGPPHPAPLTRERAGTQHTAVLCARARGSVRAYRTLLISASWRSLLVAGVALPWKLWWVSCLPRVQQRVACIKPPSLHLGPCSPCNRLQQHCSTSAGNHEHIAFLCWLQALQAMADSKPVGSEGPALIKINQHRELDHAIPVRASISLL